MSVYRLIALQVKDANTKMTMYQKAVATTPWEVDTTKPEYATLVAFYSWVPNKRGILISRGAGKFLKMK